MDLINLFEILLDSMTIWRRYEEYEENVNADYGFGTTIRFEIFT
jgi:hypothetical protein